MSKLKEQMSGKKTKHGHCCKNKCRALPDYITCSKSVERESKLAKAVYTTRKISPKNSSERWCSALR